jgi:hypothetical protein
LKFTSCGTLLRQGISPSADGDQGSAFGNCKLLKKLDKNFLFLFIRFYRQTKRTLYQKASFSYLFFTGNLLCAFFAARSLAFVLAAAFFSAFL